MKIVSFGEIMVRLGAPDYLKLVQSNTFEVSYAGAEANVAVSLANYGMQTDYVTSLPDNPIAERCIMELRGHKVGVDHIQRSGKRMGILYLETGSNARPSKVYYDREDSSIATVALGSIDWDEILKDANWFHWTGITPALSENAANLRCFLNSVLTVYKNLAPVGRKSCPFPVLGNIKILYSPAVSLPGPAEVAYLLFGAVVHNILLVNVPVAMVVAELADNEAKPLIQRSVNVFPDFPL